MNGVFQMACGWHAVSNTVVFMPLAHISAVQNSVRRLTRPLGTYCLEYLYPTAMNPNA